MDLDPSDMAVFQSFPQCFQGEVFRALAGVEGADAQVDRVGPVLHGGPQRVHGPGGRQ